MPGRFFFRLMALVRRADRQGTVFGPVPMRRGLSGDGGFKYGPIITISCLATTG